MEGDVTFCFSVSLNLEKTFSFPFNERIIQQAVHVVWVFLKEGLLSSSMPHRLDVHVLVVVVLGMWAELLCGC